MIKPVIRNSLTRWMLQVGAKMTDAALSFASEASSLSPTSSIRLLSHVDAKAVAHYLLLIQVEKTVLVVKLTGRHFAGVPMKKRLPRIP
jgi:hypothetical protein